jgi:hypothetical protein
MRVLLSDRFVGGKVERMAWDPSSKRVAVIFRPNTVTPEKDVSSRLVAVFNVTWEPYLIFSQRYGCVVGFVDSYWLAAS